MSIIERIIIVLEHKGLTRAGLARHLNKSTGQISMWEKRNTNPPSELIPDIADFLDVSIDYLLGERNKKESTIIPYSGNERIDSIVKTLLNSSIDGNDLHIIEAVLDKYKRQP